MRVAIVVETPCPTLEGLFKAMPVWAIDTPENRSIAKTSPPYSAERGLTLYDVNDPAARERNCVDVIDVIELHHPDITSLLLVGVSATDSLKAGLFEAGYEMAIEDGRVVAHRDPDKPPPY